MENKSKQFDEIHARVGSEAEEMAEDFMGKINDKLNATMGPLDYEILLTTSILFTAHILKFFAEMDPRKVEDVCIRTLEFINSDLKGPFPKGGC